MKKSEEQFADALRSVARNQKMKEYIQQSPELYPLFLNCAKRFVTGEERKDGILIAEQFIQKGYRTSLEFIGENTICQDECVQAKDEFIRLIKDCGNRSLPARISFDLSHIGLSIDSELAYTNVLEMAEEAKQNNQSLMISMEESAKTDQILAMYKRIASKYSNVGITLQAHLQRTMKDIEELLEFPGSIRVVKGAYQEPSSISIPRSEELDQRYLKLVDICVNAEHQVSIASHDEAIFKEAINRGYFNHSYAEAEMLYGIRPDLSKSLKEEGVPVRMYLTYGVEWYLYLCHRIAEFPPNIYSVITDMIQGNENSLQLY